MKNIKSKLIKLLLNQNTISVILLLIVAITITFLYILQQNIETNVQNNVINDKIKQDFYLENDESTPLIHKSLEDVKTENEVKNEFIEPKTAKEVAKEQNKQTEQKSTIESEVITDGFTHRENIPLSESVQKHIWETSKQYSIDYELILAIIRLESNFKIDAISYNESSYGLMQINKNTTLKFLASELGISNPNAFDPIQNTSMGIYYLHYLQQYWTKQGLEGDKLERATVLSYHLGQTVAKRHIKKYGYGGKYLDKIYEYKKQFE